MTTVTAHPLLELRSLHVELQVQKRKRTVLHRVDLRIGQGEAVGLVGETGSGKSMTARSIMRLLPEGAEATGDILFEDRSVLEMDRQALREFRRAKIAMIHQDPRNAMDPVRTIGDFLTESLRSLPKDERFELARKVLAEVGIQDADRRFGQFPHQLSGGLLQRVMIAGVLMPGPSLILADEPTTALDVTTQSEIMALLHDLQTSRGVGLLFITHDLDLAAAVTHSLAVMYAGVIVEQGPTTSMHEAPLHPYTAALMAARPSTTEVARLQTIPGRPVAAFETGPGCVFASRCPFVVDRCIQERPVPRPLGDHVVACHRAEELRGELGHLSEARTG